MRRTWKRQSWIWFKRYSLFLVWLVFWAFMGRDYFAPDPPAVVSSYFYEQDRSTEQMSMVMSYVELSFLYSILRPRTISRHSIGRILGALFFLLLLINYWSFISIHDSGVLAIHRVWLMCVSAMLVVALAVSTISVALAFRKKLAR
ncbi:MAG: hypothetical protein H7Z11_19115 [Verrucomicrobia bacterium]|nr:hypothetical protein [Leptolyngbya sp. ES-bin-22]